MSKTASAQLLADIAANVTRLATCVEIKRKDGRTLRLTNHDADVVLDVNSDVIRFRHDVPFSLSAISTDSALSVDNTQLTLFADDININIADIKAGLYEYAEVNIFLVDYTAPAHGTMTMRRGWFGEIKTSENRVIEITITGMLKILDFEVGRVYQPSCDADYGDGRCKVAIDFSQIYSSLNRYHLGQWVYYYNPAFVTDFTVVNPSFEADGARSAAQAITGWTKLPNNYLTVSSSSGAGGSFSPIDGTYMLLGGDDGGAAPVGLENGVWQDVDLSAAGTAAIDNGKIMIGYIAGLVQGFYLLDPVRMRIEIRNAVGEIIDAQDTDYIALDVKDKWREKGLIFPLRPGARTARIFILFRKDDGQIFNHAADRIRFFWWDHTAGSPYTGVVHQLVRLALFGEDGQKLPTNPSFEAQGLVANADGPTITGWTTGSGNWWQITNAGAGGGISNIHADYYLKGGDDGGVTQRTYSITQTKSLVGDFGLDSARILLGKYVGVVSAAVGWIDTVSAATVTIDFLNVSNGVVGSATALNAALNAGAPVWETALADFAVPTTATQVRITLQARSPVGDGLANIAFDDVKFKFYDSERPRRGDPIFASGVAGTSFNVTPGAYTIDGNLIWKAVGAFVGFDLVALVPSDKVVRGTSIAGATGSFETAAILWLSGDNAGLKNLVRGWTPGTKDLKLYYKPIFPVQVGDRFLYKRACGREFTAHCVLTFGNGINFRGFPHLPGRLQTV